MKKSILWLGIRSYVDEQLSILKSCENLDLDVVLLAPSCPEVLKGKVKFIEVSLSDNDKVFSKVKELIKDHEFVLSMTWTDPYVELNALVSQLIGTPGPSLKAATNARNKYEMVKAVHSKYPEHVPSFKLISSVNDLSGIEFPCVLKPISASGSKGIYTARNETEAKAAFDELMSLASNSSDAWSFNRYGLSFLSESYVDGKEFSVEGVVVNNKCYIAGITEKNVIQPWFVECQHIFPAPFTDEVTESIKQASAEVIEAIGLDNAPFHLEAKWSNKGFKLIEIAARIGGGLITTHLVSAAIGDNWIENVISSLIDSKPVKEFKVTKSSGIKYTIATKNGVLTKYEVKEPEIDGVNECFWKKLASDGQKIELPPIDFASLRLGYVFATAENSKSLENLFIKIESNTSVTIK